MGIGFNDLTMMMGKGNQSAGKDGKSAYEIAVSHGFKGSESEWLASLKALPYTLTEDDKALIVAQVIQSLGGEPIFGYVDEDNNIIVQGNLADGTYSVKYEMEDGSTVDIGELVLDTNTYYSVTKNLTNCVIDNSATQVVAGGSYSATITANSGYTLDTVRVTMGGSAVSVAGGVISITSVTGDIVIEAVAKEIEVEPEPTEPTNFAVPNTTNTTDISIWCNDARLGSDYGYRSQSGTVVTNYIPITGGKLYVKGMSISLTSTSMNNSISFYDASKTGLKIGTVNDIVNYNNGYYGLSATQDENGVYTFDFTNLKNIGDFAYVRLVGALSGTVDDVIITVNQPIE